MYSKKDVSGSRGSLRVGLVGHMFMGVAHSNAYRNAAIWYDMPAQIIMKAVCAKDSDESLKAFARKFGWEDTEADWRRLVSRPDVDVISIAAPGDLHKLIAVEAARHGKHVLCEKPLANSLEDAVEMLRAVEEAGVRHCCGFSYRSTPATAFAARLVAEGRLGKIHHVYARYAQDWPSSPDFPMIWRFDKRTAGSGALGDIAAHSIDLAHFITGLTFTEVCANLQTFIRERRLPDGGKAEVTVDDSAQFLCSFDNGATGCFEATRMATGRKNHNCIEINGSKGSLYWDFEEQDYLYFYDGSLPVPHQGFSKINVTHDQHPYGGGPWPQGHGIGYADTFVIEIAHFLRSIVEGQEFHPDFGDGVKVQRVLAAIEQSAVERRWISVEEV
ncbi:MAG: Gfo/Idh/MocA family protein [Acidobacteriota bacterium]